MLYKGIISLLFYALGYGFLILINWKIAVAVFIIECANNLAKNALNTP